MTTTRKTWLCSAIVFFICLFQFQTPLFAQQTGEIRRVLTIQPLHETEIILPLNTTEQEVLQALPSELSVTVEVSGLPAPESTSIPSSSAPSGSGSSPESSPTSGSGSASSSGSSSSGSSSSESSSSFAPSSSASTQPPTPSSLPSSSSSQISSTPSSASLQSPPITRTFTTNLSFYWDFIASIQALFLTTPVDAPLPSSSILQNAQPDQVAVTWTLQGNAPFSSETSAEFVYTAQLTNTEYVLASGVVLPSVIIKIDDTTSSSIQSCGIDHANATEITNESNTTLTSGQYVVVENIIDKDFVIPAGESVSLCLNGYTLDGTGTGEQKSVLEVRGSLVLEDCNASGNGAGKITDGFGTYIVLDGVASHYGGGVFVANGASFIMNSGEISGNTAGRCGGGVAVAPGGRFVMNGGTITNNSGEYGGAVYIDREGVFEMNNGSLTQNSTSQRGGGVSVLGSFTMNGGDISNNTSPQAGAGVSLLGTFTLNGGTISGNEAQNGAGVTVVEGGTVTLNNGTISGNTASRNGGGVHVENSTLILNGAVISGNTGSSGGGGVYCMGSSNFTFLSGQISENRSNSFGGGVMMISGAMQMDNGSIANNTSANNGGGVYLESNPTLTINGGTVSGNRTEAYGGGFSIGQGTVTLNDGTVSGNSAQRNGGGFSIAKGTITLNGGSVVQNTANANGGGFSVGDLLVINSGTVEHNSAAQNGGGVYLTGVSGLEGELELAGGTIRHNTAQDGGGIYLTNGSQSAFDSTLTMTGGSVVQNTASRVAGGISTGGTFFLQGEATVTGNTAMQEASNVYLPEKQTIQLTSALFGTVGVRTQIEPNPPVEAVQPASYVITASDVQNLPADDETLFSYLDGNDGIVKLTVRAISVSQEGALYGNDLPAPVIEISEEGVSESDVFLQYTGTLRNGQTMYNSSLAPQAAGTYAVTASYITESGITQSATSTFTIEPRDLSTAQVSLSSNLRYNGTLQTQLLQAVRMENIYSTTATLQPGQDYTVDDNVQKNAGNFTLRILANESGNYTGQTAAPFLIAPKDAQLVIQNANMQQGNALPTFGWNVFTGIAGETLSATNTNAIQYTILDANNNETTTPVAGTYSVVFSVFPVFSGGNNYTFITTPGTLTVTAPPASSSSSLPPSSSSSSSAPSSSGSASSSSSSAAPPTSSSSSSAAEPPSPSVISVPPGVPSEIDISRSTSTPGASTPQSPASTPENPTTPTQPRTPQVLDNGSLNVPAGTSGQSPQSIFLDGRQLAPSEYTIDEQTGDIILSPDVFSSLADGSHTMLFTYPNGEAFESTIITEEGVPLSAGEFLPVTLGSWSIFNVLATLALLLATLLLAIQRKQKTSTIASKEHAPNDNHTQISQKKDKRLIGSIIVSVAALLLLLFTQNFTLSATVFDSFSIFFFLLLGLFAIILAATAKKTSPSPTEKNNES